LVVRDNDLSRLQKERGVREGISRSFFVSAVAGKVLILLSFPLVAASIIVHLVRISWFSSRNINPQQATRWCTLVNCAKQWIFFVQKCVFILMDNYET
jgi:hypothetical protein